MTARTFAPAQVAHLTRLVTVEAEVSEGLPHTVFRGLPDDPFHTARDRVRAAIVNSGERWPDAEITVSLAPAEKLGRTSSLDLAIGVAILAAADDLPHAQLPHTVFLAELGLDGRLRAVVGIAELLTAVTRDVLPAALEDDALVLVVAAQDAPVTMDVLSRSQVSQVAAVGARSLRDVVGWLRGEAQLGLTLVEDEAE
jgi:magnesium chelatase family protein